MSDDVFDLDALVPKDDRPPFRFRFGGEDFAIEAPDRFDVRDILAVGNNPAESLLLLLGEEQWDRLDTLEAEFSMVHANKLIEGYFAHFGVDLPKSGGSRTSSRSIRGR